ncbi:MAG: 2-phosphosulfolactate phosphatase, partial [Candidatus Aureabacteria bacterium]|nr:2-phosphosulfolactate phosphatase [Candidatus Auribacterota bacterium]
MINNDNIIIAHGAEDLLSNYELKEDDTVVFIDALRASNTVLAALHCGARKIKLFSDYEEALRFKADDKDIICMGEIDAGDIKGFDFNNSPSRIIRNCGIFRDAVIAMATTNFTKAVTRTYDACCTKLIGTLLNKKALKDYLGKRRTPYGRIFLLAVGRKGNKAVEDDATAEYLREFLTGGAGSAADMGSIYRSSESAENIKEKGYGEDIDFCLKEDFVGAVPEILGDEIHKPGGDKTSDIIIVPPLVKDLVLEDYFTGKAEVLVLTNKTVQDEKVIFRADSVGKKASLDDYINVAKMLHLNEDAKSVYTDWCGNSFVCERLAFEGINLAGLFYIELIYYFIGVLKALAVSERIVAEYPDSRFFLVDDGSFWVRSFSEVAKK